MWDLPRPGLEPVSPALAGRFSTTAPPGKPEGVFLDAPGLVTLRLNEILRYWDLLHRRSAVNMFPFLPSLGFGVDPWQWGVLPFHTHLHGFEYPAHPGAAKGARGVPDHGKGELALGQCLRACLGASEITSNRMLCVEEVFLKNITEEIPYAIGGTGWARWTVRP